VLYRAVNAEFTMNVKAMASVQGADVDWDEDWYNPSPVEPPEVLESSDIRFLPIGLGFESV
jgi:hypothetical protein